MASMTTIQTETLKFYACVGAYAGIGAVAPVGHEDAERELVKAGLLRHSGASFEPTPRGDAMVATPSTAGASGETTVLIVAPFYADPYCGHPGGLVTCSEERPCRLSGYEYFTETGCARIADPSRLVTKTIAGRYYGPLWRG